MAKSLRSKRKKRLRTIRREIVKPFYDKKDEAKLKAQEAALNQPKLPVRARPKDNPDSMDVIAAAADEPASNSMDVEMADGESNKSKTFLKPTGGIGKNQIKKKLQLKKAKRRNRGKGKIRSKHNI